ncbi:MAG: hexokinase [Planctomycetota bacterium]|nr:hexokinase [Planctomycetota bacterium]
MREARDKVRRFLKDNGAWHEDIDVDEFCDIFRGEMHKGLAGRDGSLAMIPTYIEVGKNIPKDKRVIVLDAGGTNFRVAAVHFDRSGSPVIENFVQKPMPGLDREVGKKEFFATIAEYIAGVVDASDSIGFCFSYPTEIMPNRDGRLIRFCKEVKAKQVEGELIGQNLITAIKAAGHEGNKRVAILNDTVATLLAGMSASGKRTFGGYIGFILGTGSNCCYVESNRKIIKTSDLDPDKEQIVNVESGSFGKAPRGAIDFQLDESTLDPGKYTFEKMFSGGYLGALCLKALQQATKQGLLSGIAGEQLLGSRDLETKDVNSLLRYPQGDNPLAVICAKAAEQDRAAVWYVLDGLIERAARVVAAMLSSVVLETDKGLDPCEPVCITAEGTTFYELKSLRERVESYMRSFLQDRHDRFVEFVHVEYATLIGAAIAGLTN